MNPITYPSVITVVLILLFKFGVQPATAGDNTGIPPQLHVTLQDETFQFRLTVTPSNENNPWILQSSIDYTDWDDLAFIDDRTGDGDLQIEMSTASIPGQGQPTRFFRARQLEGDERTMREYLAAHSLWRTAGIDSYSMEVYWGVSWFFWDGTVTVRNKRVISAETNITNFFEPLPEPRTIDDWFDVLKRAIDRKAERIAVTYDKVFGFPADVYIDISTMIADEEQGWTISNFVPHR
jgi:hypothetical protein